MKSRPPWTGTHAQLVMAQSNANEVIANGWMKEKAYGGRAPEPPKGANAAEGARLQSQSRRDLRANRDEISRNSKDGRDRDWLEGQRSVAAEGGA